MKQFLDFITESLDNYYPIEKTPDKDTPAYVLAEYTFTHMNKLYAVRFGKAKEIASKNRALELYMGEKRSKTSVKKKMTSTSKPRMLLATLLEVLNRELTDPGQKSGSVYGYMISMQLEDFDVFAPFIVKFMRKKFQNRLVVHNTTYNPINPDKMRGIYITKKEFSFDFVFNKLELPSEEPSEEPESSAAPTVPSRKERAVSAPSRPPEEPSKPIEKVVDKQTPVTSNKSGNENPVEKQKQINAITTKLGVSDVSEIEKNRVLNKFSSIFANELKTDSFSFNSGTIPDDITKEDFISLVSVAIDSINGPTKEDFMETLEQQGISTSTFELDDVKRFLEGIRKFPDVDPFKVFKQKIRSSRRTFVANYFGMSTSSVDRIKRLIDKGVDLESMRHVNELTDSELQEIYKNTKPGTSSRNTERTVEQKVLSSVIEKSDILSKLDVDTQKKLFIELGEYKKNSGFAFGFPNDVINRLGDTIFIKSETSEELEEFSKLIPDELARYVDTGMYIKDHQMFSENFVGIWAGRGGTEVHKAALSWLNDEIQNEGTPKMWNGEIELPDWAKTNPSAVMSNKNMFEEKGQSKEAVKKFSTIYEETQEFLKEKYGKKYETKTIRLYRGVGETNATKYVPGAIESWTAVVSTAKTFAKMMGGSRGGTVFQIEVPLKEIWATFETLKKYGFPPEEHLKGKKEHILFGGALSKYPCIIYGSDTEIMSFKEYVMSEETNDDDTRARRGKQVDVMYPNDPQFKEKTKSGTGWAIEPNEDLTKGSPSSDE